MVVSNTLFTLAFVTVSAQFGSVSPGSVNKVLDTTITFSVNAAEPNQTVLSWSTSTCHASMVQFGSGV